MPPVRTGVEVALRTARIDWYAGSHASFLLEPAVRGFLCESLVASGLVGG